MDAGFLSSYCSRFLVRAVKDAASSLAVEFF